MYWTDSALVVHNYATGDSAQATPIVCAVLDACSTWRSGADLVPVIRSSPGLARRLIAALVRRGFLHRSDRPVHSSERAMRSLARWNPAAGFFHAATRNVRFMPMGRANRLLQRQARTWPMPRPVKRLHGAASVKLPRPTYAGEFPETLVARRTWRRFASAPMSLNDLAAALALSFGVQRWVHTATGDVPLKTSPSGGARHPIECYVAVRRVESLPPGIYHYASDAHRLERVRRGDPTARIRAWMPHSDYFARAAVVILLTAVFERQLWRYGYARAYRAALAEAGHVCQTFCLTATWLGLAPFCLMGLADSEIERDLRIDGITESVLYAAGAGVRPRGTSWAPLSRGSLIARDNPVFRKR